MELASLLDTTPVRRCFGAIPAEELEQLVARAQEQDPNHAPTEPRLLHRDRLPDGVDPQTVAPLLAQVVDVVEYAYVPGIPDDPFVVGTTNPLFPDQRYLSAAPNGIDARAAWAKGADGSGVRFVDIERGWFLKHEDLPTPIHLLEGVNEPASHHGTAVLGEVVGIDNDFGIVGIAPGCTVDVLSYSLRVAGKRRSRTAEVIASAAKSGVAADRAARDTHRRGQGDQRHRRHTQRRRVPGPVTGQPQARHRHPTQLCQTTTATHRISEGSL